MHGNELLPTPAAERVRPPAAVHRAALCGAVPVWRIHPISPSPREGRAGEGSGSTAVELSQLRRTWSAEFIPLPADLHVPRGGGLKSALLNSRAEQLPMFWGPYVSQKR